MAERVVVALEAVQVVSDEHELAAASGKPLEVGDQPAAVSDPAQLVAARLVERAAIGLPEAQLAVDARAALESQQMEEPGEREDERQRDPAAHPCDEPDRGEERVDRADPGER